MTPRNAARRHLLAAVATIACTGGWLAGAATAQPAWPSQPVKILVGFPGGSTPDISARALADALAKAWGQPVVVENRPGAGGNLAADAVAKATDGHTLGVVINGNLTTAKPLNPRLPFDPDKDFAVISWLAAARAAGDKWSYGSVGIGSVGHLGGELVNGAIGGSAVHVPYNGNPAVLTALLGGQIQLALVPPGLALPQVRAGKLHAIGVTGPKSELAPGVPALADLGVRMPPLEVWNALVAPAGMPRAALERLARDVPAVMKEAETRQRFLAGGWEPVGSDAAAAAVRVQAEARLLGEIITRRGIRLE
jgi:tripartite-type tricarboxylate transporter receptor subunit TctC